MSQAKRLGCDGKPSVPLRNPGSEDGKLSERLSAAPEHATLANLALGNERDSIVAELIAAGVPLAVRIPQACALTSLGRTTLYDAIGDEELAAHKKGDATLIYIWDL